MICVYLRSSSLNNYSYCEMQYFITYVLGYQSLSGKKADIGTMCHKVMEILAKFKKELQNSPKTKKIEIQDDALGNLSTTKTLLYKEKIVSQLLDLSFDYYSNRSPHNTFSKKDKEDCLNMCWSAIQFNGGQFDPRNRNIVEAEPHFDIPIEEDWAKYTYNIDGKEITGQLAIKGTIDLVTESEPGIIEVIDWKGLPLYTKLPTPQGFTTMGEIQEGDEVFDQFGNICTVVGKSKIKVKNCYKIYFDDKTSAICDDEHLWKLSNGNIVQVKDLVIGNTINVAHPIDCPYIDLPIDPYLLGVWLGDGRNRSCEISSGDSEIFKNILSLGFSIGVDQENRTNTLSSHTVLGQTSILRKLGLLNNKHIPDIYFRANYEQRLSLLRGLMDTDGNVNQTRKQCVFTTCNKKLSDDVVHLLRTLGQRPSQAYIKRDTNFKNNVEIYPVSFRPIRGLNPFNLERKSSLVNRSWGDGKSSIRKIVSINKTITQKTQCISVNSPDNTYLCTENYIPTHNTGRRLDWATGEEKTYAKLTKDPQLLLYNYAISKLFPQYKQSIMSIFFIRDGGPFSMCFDESDQANFLQMLKEKFEAIKANNSPKPISEDRSNWKCTKLCHFCKNNWPETNQSMCVYIDSYLQKHGMEKTVKDCKKEGFEIGFYEAPG